MGPARQPQRRPEAGGLSAPAARRAGGPARTPPSPRYGFAPVSPRHGLAPADGLPEPLKTNIEAMSGFSLEDVRVHFSSPEPAKLGALAFTLGSEIDLGRGQERHLPHEAWHAVQQKQGRVRATPQAKGVAINDDCALETEADAMGARAASAPAVHNPAPGPGKRATAATPVVQRLIDANAFALQTPARLFKSRESVRTIDAALNVYHAAAPAAKLAALDALTLAIDTYVNAKVAAGDAANSRVAPARALRQAAVAERPHVAAIDAGLTAYGAAAPGNRLAALDALALALNAFIDALLRRGEGDQIQIGPVRTLLVQLTQQRAQAYTANKILRGRTDAPLGPNEIPTAAQRGLIGGHSREILNMPATFAVEGVAPPHANLTEFVNFRKLLRPDAGFAAAVAVGAPGNVADEIDQAAQVAIALAAHPPALPPDFLARAPAHVVLQRQQAQAAAAAGVQALAPALIVSRGAAQAAAVAAAAAPDNATAIDPFFRAVMDLHESARQILAAVPGVVQGTVNPLAANAAAAALDAAITTFRQQGPVMSTTKGSTIPPAGVSEQDILDMGDLTGAEPTTLFRDRPAYAPADGAPVESKHQLLHNNIVWVAIKEGVTYRIGPPPTLAGGRIVSVYPTALTVIPANPAPGVSDGDGFRTL